MRRTLASLAILLLTTVAGCRDEHPTLTAVDDAGRSGSRATMINGILPVLGRAVWLAPLGGPPAIDGALDTLQAPSVEVCEWSNGQCVRTVSTHSVGAGPGGISIVDGAYQVNWPITSTSFMVRRTYRIAIATGGRIEGAILVDAMRGRWGLTAEGMSAPLRSASFIPIRFWIGEGRLVGVDGGELIVESANATVSVGANVYPSPVTVQAFVEDYTGPVIDALTLAAVRLRMPVPDGGATGTLRLRVRDGEVATNQEVWAQVDVHDGAGAIIDTLWTQAQPSSAGGAEWEVAAAELSELSRVLGLSTIDITLRFGRIPRRSATTGLSAQGMSATVAAAVVNAGERSIDEIGPRGGCTRFEDWEPHLRLVSGPGPGFVPCDTRELRRIRRGTDNSALPVVLIHGWDRNIGDGISFQREQGCGKETVRRILPPSSETVRRCGLSAKLPGEIYMDAWIRAFTQWQPERDIYVYTYESHDFLRETGASLERLLRDRAVSDSHSAFVLVGHSMGGLVARAAAQASEREAAHLVAGIITLASPHLGSGWANPITGSFYPGIPSNGGQDLGSGLGRDETVPLYTYSGGRDPVVRNCSANPRSEFVSEGACERPQAPDRERFQNDEAVFGAGRHFVNEEHNESFKNLQGPEADMIRNAVLNDVASLQGLSAPRTLEIDMSGPMFLTHTQDLGTSTSCTTQPPYGPNAVCTRTYRAGTQVTLQVTTSSAYRFLGWTGACSGTGACTVVMDDNVSIGAAVELIGSSSIAWCGTSTDFLGNSLPSGYVSRRSSAAGRPLASGLFNDRVEYRPIDTGFEFGAWGAPAAGTSRITATFDARLAFTGHGHYHYLYLTTGTGPTWQSGVVIGSFGNQTPRTTLATYASGTPGGIAGPAVGARAILDQPFAAPFGDYRFEYTFANESVRWRMWSLPTLALVLDRSSSAPGLDLRRVNGFFSGGYMTSGGENLAWMDNFSISCDAAAENPAMSMSVTPQTLIIAPGGHASASVEIGRSGGFAGSVVLEVVGPLPSGVASSVVDPAFGAQGSVRFDVSQNAPAFVNHEVRIRASGSGVSAVERSLIISRSAAPAIALSAAPTRLSINTGSSGTTNVSISRSGGYSGSVALTVLSPLPAGVTHVATNPGTGASGAVRFDVAQNSASFSSHPVRIRASGSGVESVEETVFISRATIGSIAIDASPRDLTINPGGSGTAAVSVSRSSGFTGSIDLAVLSTLPSGVTRVVMSPGTGTTGSVRFDVATNGALFSGFPVRIRASANGVDPVETTVFITRATVGSITMIASPPSLNISGGGSGTTFVSISRSAGYSGSVTLTVLSALPGGVSRVITNPGTGSSGSVRFDVAPNSALFTNHQVRIRASGAGVNPVEQIVTISRQ